MSHATKDLHKYDRVTTIRTIGGYDVDDAQYPDLYVRGGAIIKKNLWLYGDLMAANIESLGNTTVGGELLVYGNSQFFGNVNIDGKLNTDDICANGTLLVNGTSQFNDNVTIATKLTATTTAQSKPE